MVRWPAGCRICAEPTPVPPPAGSILKDGGTNLCTLSHGHQGSHHTCTRKATQDPQ